MLSPTSLSPSALLPVTSVGALMRIVFSIYTKNAEITLPNKINEICQLKILERSEFNFRNEGFVTDHQYPLKHADSDFD